MAIRLGVTFHQRRAVTMKTLFTTAALALVFPAVLAAQGSPNGQQHREQNEQQRMATEAQHHADQAERNAAKERKHRSGAPWVPSRPMVQRDGSHWVAPVYGPNDLHLAKPWQDGHFTPGVGPDYIWQLQSGTRERFNLGNRAFAVAPADNRSVADWRWASDEVVLYPDAEHAGWYLAYNPRLGSYSHVRLLGPVR
jgi:hypothetical protein